MKKPVPSWVACLGACGLLLAGCASSDDQGSPACADPALATGDAAVCVTVPYSVTDHETIATEEGTVALLDGHVVVRRLSLFDGDREVVWLENQVFDLGGTGGYALALDPLPPGSYDRMEIVLGPSPTGQPTFEGNIQADGQPPLHVVYDAELVGERFPDPFLEIDASNGAAVVLPIRLIALFFYTWPYASAVEGEVHIQGPDEARASFEANLLNLWTPILSP